MNTILSPINLSFDSFSGNSVLYCNFDSLPVRNIANGEIFVPISGSGGSLDDGRFVKALKLDKDTKLAYSGVLDVSSQMTFSFWMKSVNYGIVYDQSDSEIYYNTKIPVFGKASWSISSSTQSFVINNNSSFLIYEKCYEDNTNSIILELYSDQSGQFEIYRYESDRYSISKNHHFYIVYNGIEGYVRIYIDGILTDVLITDPDGQESVPSVISSSSGVVFTINEIAPGTTASVVGNSAIIEDMFICNNAFDNEVLIKKIINRGVGEVFSSNESFSRSRQTLFLPYKEISTNYLTSIAGNSSEIYLGSSYGDIYKGSSTLWSSRRNFTNKEEIDNLKLIKYDSSDKSYISTENGDGITIDGYGIELE